MRLPSFKRVSTASDADAFLARIYPNGVAAKGWEECGVDTEFDDDAPSGVFLSHLQIANLTEAVVIEGPLTSLARGRDLNLPLKFAKWMKDPKVKKVLSTMSADFRSLRAGGLILRGLSVDTEICDWLYEENERSHGLKAGADRYLGLPMRDYKDLFGYYPKKKDGELAKKKAVASMSQVVEGNDGPNKYPVPWTGAKGRSMAFEYAALDPWASLKLAKFFRPKLKEQKIWRWYHQIERPLAQVLLNMEDRGIRVDMTSVARIRKEVIRDLLRIEYVARSSTDQPELNLRSVPQLKKLLFEELGWPVLKNNEVTAAQEAEGRTEGEPSLAAGLLEEYAKKGFKFADLLLAHRSKSTLKSVFLDGVLEKSERGVVHTIFKQARTVTGRLSSGDRLKKKMNVQNIPAKKEKDPYRLRQFFLPTKPGHDLIVLDYSQIELYIIAVRSGDERMLQAFHRGEDLHSLTASKIFNIKLPKEPTSWDPNSAAYKAWKQACSEWKEKNSDRRGNGKTVNFGLNYGMSKYKLAADFKMELDEAQRWIDAYFELYPGVQRYTQRTIAFVQKYGYVKCVSGRRRRLGPLVHSREAWMRGAGERQAINAPIQGTAADIIKVAMVALEFGNKFKPDERFMLPMPEAQQAIDLGYEQLIQVHDEIVGQCPSENSEQVKALVKKVAEAPFPKFFEKLAIVATIGSGPNWAEAKR